MMLLLILIKNNYICIMKNMKKPEGCYDTYIDKLIKAKKDQKAAKELAEETSEAMVKMAIMSSMHNGMKKMK
jgi:hypothetical protein